MGFDANPLSNSTFDTQSPELSPVNILPVLFPPWAAGARPTISICAFGSPKLGKGRPQYCSEENEIFTDLGIVQTALATDKEPIYNGNPTTGTRTTSGLVNYNQWYNHVNTINDCTTYDITLNGSTSNPNTFVYNSTSFFPIDGQLFGNEGKPHNYHFTYQVNAKFTYQSGQNQVITLSGDDDIWVFINGNRVLDLGGIHPIQSGTIRLDTLGLTSGQTYDFALFFAERQTTQSDLGISTNVQFTPVPAGQCKAVDAVNDSATTNGIPVTINALSNDSGITAINSITTPTSGTAVISGTSIVYTPAPGFAGTAYLTYEGVNTSGASDTATIIITVGPPVQLYCGLPESSYFKVIRGTNGNNNLVGTQQNDLILGNGGKDNIEGLGGNDCIYGGDGDDKINGNNGDDTIYGGSGKDNITGNNDHDNLYGEDNDDKIEGGNGDDLIDGGNNKDQCKGGSGNNTILQCEQGDQNTGSTKILTGTIRDFKASFPDMEQGCSGLLCDGVELGIVKNTLGSDNKPVFNQERPSTNGASNFNKWYNDVSGTNMAKPFTLTLKQSNSDPNVYTYNSGDDGFFPIDDELLGNERRDHNYHFTLELHSTFQFQNGQMFKFTGDDDVWVFVDKKLVLDLGGVHPESSKTITAANLAALGLVPGQTYQLDIFFAERQTTESNFRIDTSFGMS